MAFDEAEMDMIRRGDMLGPKLGAKVATALEALQRERDEAAPKFTGVAKAKLDDLTSPERGWKVCGYAVEKDGAYGLVTTGAFVGWYTAACDYAEAAEANLAEAREALMGLVDLSDEVVDFASDNPDWEQVAYRFADALIRARATLTQGG